MPVNVLGFQTHRDHFAIDFEQGQLLQRITIMRKTELDNSKFTQQYDLRDNRDWKLNVAREQLRQDDNWKARLIQCAYRPFDSRWAYFSEVAMDYPRRELKEHVAGRKNLCLGVGRQGIAVQDLFWSLLTVAVSPIDANVFRRGGVNIFPLYIYPSTDADLFDDAKPGDHRPNLDPEFIANFSARLKLVFVQDACGDLRKTFGPEDVFHYAYAVFHSPTYRSRYAEFLKIDFPRLPLTHDVALFRSLCALGKELVALHLMEQLSKPETRYPVAGDNTVEAMRYTEPSPPAPLPEGEGSKGRVWINQTQYFDNVPPEVWAYHIGGYQVCHKWLKDRKGRQLSYDDLTHYRGIVAALARTIELQAAIDAAIGKWPLQ